MLSDEERQQDEVFALQNIYTSSEFRCKKKTSIECSFSISCDLINENMFIKYNTYHTSLGKKLFIKYLPPIRFYVRLPQNYPSASAPQYYLAINWLPPWEVSLVCQKLDELWQQNEGNEILFIWLEFLKSELLSYLNLSDTLEITYLFELFKNPVNEFFSDFMMWMDNRVVCCGLDLNPIEKLLEYNELAGLLEFQSTIQECGICFETYSGKMCIRINICNHAFCKKCIESFLTMKINERNVINIKCPAFGCEAYLKLNQMKEICTSELIQKYEQYLLEIKLITKRNLVYCPRKICQTAVIIKDGENLASCPSCEYNFCVYCFKVYHGVMPCDMNAEDKLNLIKEYENGNNLTKKRLERKYGKQHIKEIVIKQLTKDYLQENAKLCPTCKTSITKISGCNIMSCSHCHTNFCWLCNCKIVSEDIYAHFKSTSKGSCVGRLFEGADESSEIDEFYAMENMELAMFYDSD